MKLTHKKTMLLCGAVIATLALSAVYIGMDRSAFNTSDGVPKAYAAINYADIGMDSTYTVAYADANAYTGTVSAVKDATNFTISCVHNNVDVTHNIKCDDKTMFVNTDGRKVITAAALQVGTQVSVYHEEVIAGSKNPAYAYAVLVGKGEGAHYIEVAECKRDEFSTVTLLGVTKDVMLTLSTTTAVKPYDGTTLLSQRDIKEKSRIVYFASGFSDTTPKTATPDEIILMP